MAINLDVHGNTQPLEAAVQSAVNRIRRQPIKISVDDKGATQPLGNMKRAADEFSKSMEAANARIIAFGASMAIINGMADAFKGMVRNMVEVEKSLADINVVMGLSTQKLEAFSDGLFKVAKETGAAFKVAADAATEYARQGLNVEESLKRTKDALILTRLTGMDSAEAVKSLTAAMNTYGNQIKDTTQLVSKFAAVDVKFAVSAEDFADAISRTGAAAKGAGVNIDELIGLVTAAQQQTARGGKVIGNSFKTIFTRIGRTDTLNQLENLGIAVRDIEGKTLGAKKILTDLANTFDSLSEAQKAQIAQTVGGVFQINVLKAVLGDAAKQNGILANATQISAGATNEAIEKNEQLRNTMAAVATETGLAIKQVSAQIGEIMLAPGIEKVLNIVKSGAEGLSGILGDGEGSGNKFANGFLKGLGNVISGPGLVIITAVFGKLFLKAASFAKESLTSLIGVTSEAQKQKAIQTSLVGLFGRSSELSKEMLRTDISRTEKEKIILGLLRAQVAEAKMLDSVAKSSAATLYSKGFGANLTPRRGRAYGHIPNFANPEREQAARGGYAAGSIRSMDMPGEGSVIYNSAEKVKTFSGLSQPAIMPPLSSKAGKNYQQAFGSVHGFDPYAAGGYIPNFNSIGFSEKEMEGKYKSLARNKVNMSAFNKAAGGKLGGKAFKKEKGFKNPVIDLNQIYPGVISQLGVILGVGAETESPIDIRYSTPISEVNPDSKKTLAQKIGVNVKDLKGKTLLGTLPTKAISPVSEQDLNLIRKGQSDSVARKTIGDLVKDPLRGFAKRLHKNIFKGSSKGQKPDFTSENIVKHIDPGTLGNLYETSLRTAIGDRIEDNKQASFDFRGADASELSKFLNDKNNPTKRALELKYTLASAKSGGIPKKILNYISGHADGFIPNFANPLSDAIGREREAGIPVSQIRVGTHPALMNKGNPIGLGVTNTKDEPNGLKDVFGAKGYVPNYASNFLSDFSAGRDEYKSAAELQKELNVENKKLLKEQKELNQLKKSGKDVTKRLQGVEKQLTRNLQDQAYASKMAAESTKKMGVVARAGGLTQKAINANQAFSNNAVGRGLSGFGGMGLMMGAPMIAGFLQEGRQGETERERVQRMQGGSYAAGGALMGAGTGAAMGMMFGPLGTAIGGVIGAISGLTGALDESEEAIKEEARVRSMRISTSITSNQDVMNVVSQAAKMGKLKEFSDQDVKDRLSKAAPVAFKRKTTQGLIDEFKNRSGLVYKKEKDPLLVAAKASYPSFQSKQFESFNMNPKKFAMELEKAALKDERTRLERKNFANLFRELPADQKIISQNLLDPEDKKNKIFTGSEYANMIEGLPLEDFKKSKSDIDAKRLLLEEEANRSLSKQNAGIILQLNLQKAQLKAQKAAAMSQLKIKDEYDKQQIDLKALTSLGGEFLTERQKSEIKYQEALNKASEQLALKEDSASNLLKEQLMGIAAGDNTTKNALKQALLEREEGFSDKSDEEKKALAEKMELEKELAKLTEEELINLYNQLKVGVEIKLQIENFITAKKNSVDLAEKEKELAGERADKEKEINNLVANRLDAIKKQKEAHQDYIRTMALGDKISNEARKTAKLQRTLSDGPDYKRIQESHDIKFREKEIDLNYQIAEIRKNQLIEESKEAEKRLDLTQRQKALESKKDDYKDDKGKTKAQLEKELNVELQKSEDRSEQIRVTNDVIVDQKIKQLSLEKQIAAEQIKHEASFSGGFTDASDKMLDDASRLDYQLGTITATHFRDGLVTAMDAAIDSSKDLGDALQGVAMGFLQAMQGAFLTSAANTVVGAIGLSSGGNVRNYSNGGGVPAMVSNGEYVMNRRAVNKYGSNFMHQINARGKVPKYNSGGSVNSLESFFSPQPQFSVLPPRSFKDRMMDFFQNEKNMKLFQQEYQKAQLKNLQQSTIKKTSLAEAFSSPINSGSQMGLAKAFSAPINTGSTSSLPDFPVNKNANIFEETRKSLVKQKDLEIRNARTSLEIPKIEAKYNYLTDKINNPKANPFNYAAPSQWRQKGSPNYLLPDFIKNKPIDTSYKKYGFGSYGVGAVKRFSAGGPAPGSALAANFGPGKGVESGRAYQSMPMSGFFYSGQAESVAIQEDVDSMNEILREEKKRKMEALQKKMKKKALKNQLLSTALSAGLSMGVNSLFDPGATFVPGGVSAGMEGSVPIAPGDFNNGGKINKYASGGFISGKSGIDQIPAMLSEGEYVIKANSVRQMGKPLLDKINAGKFYDGGLVGDGSSGSRDSSSSSTNNINITLNLDKSGKKSEEQSQDGDSDSKDQRERMKEFTEKIKMQVLSVIVEEQKPGGLLQDTK